MKQRNVFNLSRENKFTCNMGQLIPVFCDAALPGDKWKMKTDFVLRLAPMLAPMMHNVNAYVHYFKIPCRLLMDDWEKFITGGKNNDDTTPAPVIVSPEGGFQPGSLGDFLGVPTGVAGLESDAFPFRAYAKVYNDWYRDENLIDELPMSTGYGKDVETNTALQRRAWQKGYFTNSLPWPQRGDPVYLPLGTEAPVISNGVQPVLSSMNIAGSEYPMRFSTKTSEPDVVVGLGHSSDGGAGIIWNKTGMKADMTSASAITVDALRSAIQVQLFANLVGRAGYRYVEYLKSFFGVTSSDARLQRSEYIGGFKCPIMISEVLQTSSTDSTSPQGNMSGHGIAANQSRVISSFFEEHCIILGILSVMPKYCQSQGLRRMWSHKTRFDYFVPLLAHLGQQAVLNKEIYAQGTADDDGIFGYQDRYDEYRQAEDEVHGQFRTTLDYWTMNQKYAELPKLNKEFVECTPTKGVFAVPSEDCCIVDMYHRVKALRMIPTFGDPGYMDHYYVR